MNYSILYNYFKCLYESYPKQFLFSRSLTCRHTLCLRCLRGSDEIVPPNATPRIILKSVYTSDPPFFPMCCDRAAADIAMASDNLTSSGSSLSKNTSSSCGLSSRRISRGVSVRSSNGSLSVGVLRHALTVELQM